MTFKFSPEMLGEALSFMWKGMLGVFIVILIIMAAVWLLNQADKIGKNK